MVKKTEEKEKGEGEVAPGPVKEAGTVKEWLHNGIRMRRVRDDYGVETDIRV